VTEQPEHGAGGNVEIEVTQGPEVPEALAQPHRGHAGAAAGVEPADGTGGHARFRMVYCGFVHSTTNISSTLYDMATEKPSRGGPPSRPRRRPTPNETAERVVKKIDDKLIRTAAQIDRKAAQLDRKAAQLERVSARLQDHQEILEHLSGHLGALEVWTRTEPGGRPPRCRCAAWPPSSAPGR
jgi:hypothetical protein